jgi:hypothetical protein
MAALPDEVTMSLLVSSAHPAAAVEDALGVAAVLAVCGGFLDAFTYLHRPWLAAAATKK